MASLATFLHKAENWWFPYFVTENGNGESEGFLTLSGSAFIQGCLSKQNNAISLSTYHGLVLQYAQ